MILSSLPRMLYLTSRTELAEEPLPQHKLETCGQQACLYTNLDKPCQGTCRIIRVKCAQYQMTGKGSPEPNLCGLFVSNLSHHDDVWVLSERMPQRHSKIEPYLFLDLCLVDPIEGILDGIFDGQNVQIWPIDM
jgi:hypothetical protein